MSQSDGFDRMDVATSIADDRKFRQLGRRHPELLGAAGWAYVGLLAASWREGQRLTLEEAWPVLLPDDPAVSAALLEAGLVDDDQRIPWHAWEGWFGAASERRRAGRERHVRYNRKRPSASPSVSQTDSPSGSHDNVTTSLRRFVASERR